MSEAKLEQELDLLEDQLIANMKRIHVINKELKLDDDDFSATFNTITNAIDTALDPNGSGFGLGGR